MSIEKDPIVIVAAARTPLGSFQGVLSSLTSPSLGAIAIKEACLRAKLSSEDIQEVIMGCVLPAGVKQAPARQAALGAGLSIATGCTTINKVCGSGLKAVMLANDLLHAGVNEVMVAGGFESMSNAPYLLAKARAGYRLGHGDIKDSMFLDGLEDAYEGHLMGTYAEATASKYQFTRQMQDDFTIASLQRAQKAIHQGYCTGEIAPVTIASPKGDTHVLHDEGPGNAKIEKIPLLKPAFAKEGTVTAANSSSISDGAAALVLMRRSVADQRGLKPLAQIVAHATHSQEPGWFTTAPVGAMKKLAEKANWDLNSVDLFEINEAFAIVTMAAMHDLKLPHEKVNIHGGACALGHPIGASGARILVTLLSALQQYDLKRGVASLCIGGGEAVALAVERI